MQEDVYRGDGLNLYAYCKNNPVVYYDPSGYGEEKCDKVGGNDSKSGRASELPTIEKGTKEWDEAVKSIANGGNTSYRTKTATEAKELLNEARGNMNRYKQYTSKQYKKGYEMHPNEINTRNAPHNDLPHVKWKDWLDELHSGKGHIFFDKPN